MRSNPLTDVLVGGYRPEEISRPKEEEVRKEKELEAIAREQAGEAETNRARDDTSRSGSSDADVGAKPTGSPDPSSLGFPFLKDSDKYITISRVRHRGHDYVVDIWKGQTNVSVLGSPLPEGRAHTLPDVFYLMSAPFYFSVLDTLYLIRDSPTPAPAPGVMPVCEAQALLWRMIANQPIITSTSVQYYTMVSQGGVPPLSDDSITHNEGFGSPWEYTIKNKWIENLCGLDDPFPPIGSTLGDSRLSASSGESICEMLLGINQNRFRSISHWLTGNLGYLTSLPDRPRQGSGTKAHLCMAINKKGLTIDIRPNTYSWAIPMRARDIASGQWVRP